MKIILLIFILFVSSLVGQDKNTEILWDTYGVPHIYANDESSLYKAFGWAQMHNHADLILRLYGESRGRSAEYWGTKLEQDKMLHLLNFPELGKTEYNQLNGNLKNIVDSFVSGMNAYAQQNPDRIAEELKVVLPVKPDDILAHLLRTLYYDFLISPEIGKGKSWSPGSNAWAVGPKLTVSGNSILLANPHMPWLDEMASYRFMEAQLNRGDNMQYGVALIGVPILGIAFNHNLGWTHTVNPLDNVDLYDIKVKDGKYILDGTSHDFDISEITIKSRDKNGEISEEKIERKVSKHGVIISEKGDNALALRYPYMTDPPQMVKQWYDMGQAKNFDEFEAALKQNALPLFNVIYVDKDKNIFYSFAGNVPQKKGDWADWKNEVSGAESDLIWDSYHSYSELPKLKNPKSGWLQNANDGPYFATYPQEIKASDYDEDISESKIRFRPQQSIQLISEAKDLTLEKFIGLKNSTSCLFFFRIKDELEAMKKLTTDPATLEGLNALTSWNGNFDADNMQAAFFIGYFISPFINYSNFWEIDWSADAPLSTPDGIKDPEKKLKILKGFTEYFKKRYGSLEIPYGDLYRIKIGEREIPANGGIGSFGVFRTLDFQPGEDGKSYAYMGDGYVCATEFGEEPTAKVLMTFGNASQKGSKHIGDQLDLFAKKEMRDALLTKEDVEANLEERETIK
ncbi:penicillin acylase family protein [Aequorivita sp. CIP111184]|uniref:penicillin acylase family protein n=1 Tax=Aequorivita sp. CIP111184 TaxID=2211356 RepID=UPI000DBC2316|nr:penicillin acylase family protein [Aequorivita sp. CIP111184]SRX52885.1 Glutaryl-7-aminocephalosporanic-acid acylase [Aequorivita sp. CIP111184]